MSPDVLPLLARLGGLVVISGGLAAGIGIVHRWYAGDRVPEGLAVLVGLSGVALSLNTTIALGEVIGGDLDALALEVVLLNVAAFIAAALAASGGGRAGDRLGQSVLRLSGARAGIGDGDVSAIVRSVGRVITVDLPDDADDIRDMDGYDAVAPGVKAKLAGKTLTFPRRLTVEELRERFVARLETDYGIGHVDVDLTEDGEVEYLAVGSRAAGLGPTLPPETAALAVRADPAYAASPGDVVQIWRTEPGSDTGASSDTEPGSDTGPERVTTAEVRGTAGDVVTVAVDAAETGLLDTNETYRLLTLPVEPRADREFASLLRAAEETMAVVTVDEGSALSGTPVGGLDVAVLAVRSGENVLETIPPGSRILAAGERLYVVARPDVIRRLEEAARPAAATTTPADA